MRTRQHTHGRGPEFRPQWEMGSLCLAVSCAEVLVRIPTKVNPWKLLFMLLPLDSTGSPNPSFQPCFLGSQHYTNLLALHPSTDPWSFHPMCPSPPSLPGKCSFTLSFNEHLPYISPLGPGTVLGGENSRVAKTGSLASLGTQIHKWLNVKCSAGDNHSTIQDSLDYHLLQNSLLASDSQGPSCEAP